MANPILEKAQGTPANAGNSLEQAVTSAVAQDVAKSTKLVGALQANQSKARAVQDDVVAGIKSTTTSDIISQVARDTADLQVQNQSNAILQAAGGTDTQVKLMRQMKEQGDNVDSLLAEKDAGMKEEPTGFLPLDLIINSFRTIDTDVALRTATEMENHTANRINNISAAQSSFAQTNAAAKKSINEATIAANSRKIEQLAGIEASKQELANLHNNSQALLTINQADAGVTKSLLTAYQLQGDMAAREVQKEELVARREAIVQRRDEWEFRKPTMQAQLEASQLQLETAKFTNESTKQAVVAKNQEAVRAIEVGKQLEFEQVDGVQRAQAAAGKPIETAVVINARFNDPATRKQYVAMQVIGSTPNQSFGTDAADAYKNFRTNIDPSGTLPDTKYTALFDDIVDVQRAVYDSNPAIKPPKDEPSLMADFNAAADTVLKGYATNIKAGDGTNPYQAPPMEVLAAKQAVKTSALYHKVLATQGFTEVVPQQIVAAALNGVRAGVVTIEEAAAGIDTLFTAAAVHNNTDKGGFARVGMSNHNQVSYNTQLPRTPTAYEAAKVLGTLGITAINPFSYAGAGLKEKATAKLQKAIKYERVNLMDTTAIKYALVQALGSETIPKSAGNMFSPTDKKEPK